MKALRVLHKSAELSTCGQYRWWLRRQWAGGNGQIVCFIMLNPSTADADLDDPTIRRCIGFAQDWGFSMLSVRNLFAYRATDPKTLLSVQDPVGGSRGNAELLAGCTAHITVVAWGSYVPWDRDRSALAMIEAHFPGKQLLCLGITKHGKPRHPLYVPASQPLVPYEVSR